MAFNVGRRMLTKRLSLVAIGLLVAACGSAAVSTNSPNATASGPPRTTDDGIDHPRGRKDVVLRFEEGGGFVPVDFIATQAPTFTLYGDGTVVFRNALEAPPDKGDGIGRNTPFRIARLSEEQVQALLDRAINRGALGVARAQYDPRTIADAPTATFTLNAGSIRKTVAVVALGMETEPGVDTLTLKALAELGELLRNFDASGSSGAGSYEPTSYRGRLWDAGGPAAATIGWPWADLKPSDFKAPAGQPDSAFRERVLTAEEASALGVEGIEGGALGMVLDGPDGQKYSFALRPLLPDEAA